MATMNRPALFVSDLDGTLLQTDGTLSAFTHETLCAFHRDGVPFTVASGRNFSSIRRALGSATLGLPLISSDGALISHFDSPKPIHLFKMDPLALEALHSELWDRGFSPVLDIWDGEENFLVAPEVSNPVLQWYYAEKQAEVFAQWRFAPVTTIPAHWQGISLTLLDTPARLAPLRDEIHERFGNLFKTDYAELSAVPNGAALWIQHANARKENALAELSRLLGMEGASIVVFGDELNDLGMFGREWHAVAVGNARQELKDKAHEVIGHHTEDPVPRYVRRFHP
jgi:Cof subfamily protein (haloacid dehalogenase superfamily)